MTDEFRVSLFVPEDAPDISRFYREMYGDTFPVRYVYDPGEIARRYDGLNHRTAVVRDAQGGLAGVGSLFRSAPNPLLYEAGQLMVAKRHRGKGVSSLIQRVVAGEYPTQIPLDGLFMEALCSHTASQHTAAAGGLRPTGVELEWLPAARPGQAAISLLLFFRIDRDNPHAVHPHPAHADFVAQRVRELGLERAVEPGRAPEIEASAAEPAILRPSGIATLTVAGVGRDWSEVLARFEADAAGCALHVPLNLGDPAAPWAVDALRARGFFLAAYLPLWFGTDGVLLQKLPEAPDFSAPQYETEAGRAVADAVRADWETVTGGK